MGSFQQPVTRLKRGRLMFRWLPDSESVFVRH